MICHALSIGSADEDANSLMTHHSRNVGFWSGFDSNISANEIFDNDTPTTGVVVGECTGIGVIQF
jgi:hypothetical protein